MEWYIVIREREVQNKLQRDYESTRLAGRHRSVVYNVKVIVPILQTYASRKGKLNRCAIPTFVSERTL